MFKKEKDEGLKYFIPKLITKPVSQKVTLVIETKH